MSEWLAGSDVEVNIGGSRAASRQRRGHDQRMAGVLKSVLRTITTY